MTDDEKIARLDHLLSALEQVKLEFENDKSPLVRDVRDTIYDCQTEIREAKVIFLERLGRNFSE